MPQSAQREARRVVGFYLHLERLHRERRDALVGSLSASLWVARYVLRYAAQRNRRLNLRSAALKNFPETIKKISQTKSGDSQVKIAILVTGGIGDYIVIARFLRDLMAHVEPLQFTIFCQNIDAADWIFAAIPGFSGAYSEFLFEHVEIVDNYVVSLRINHFVTAHAESAVWPELRKHPKLRAAIERVVKFRPQIEVFVQNHPYMDNFLAQKSHFMNRNRENFLHAIAGVHYSGARFDLSTDHAVLARYALKKGGYITFNNGFDADYVIAGKTATKCYPHFDALVVLLKEAYPGVPIVQIGTKTSTPVASADLDLISKTTLSEAATLLQSALIHIDNEGGLVHLAASLGTPSCVIFGPTSVEYFSYAQNLNIAPASCGNCWWITRSWMDICPRGFETPRCLFDRKPSDILNEISAFIDGSSAVAESQQTSGAGSFAAS